MARVTAADHETAGHTPAAPPPSPSSARRAASAAPRATEGRTSEAGGTVDVYEFLGLTISRKEDPDEKAAGEQIWAAMRQAGSDGNDPDSETAADAADAAAAGAGDNRPAAEPLWDLVQAAQDRSLERPHAIAGVRPHYVNHPGEGETYILKHPTRQQLLRLKPDGFFLWQRFTGENTVQDLAYEYLIEFGAVAPEKVLDLIDQARARGFLRSAGPDVYRAVQRTTAEANVKVAWKLQEFFNRKWSIPNFDRIVGGIYHWGGFLAFNRLGLLLCIPLIGFGFGRWVTEVGNPANELLKTNGSLLLGLLTYVLIKIFIGFLHELGQALYLKSLRREVPEGGIIWYYGIPYMFHNSNDIWLESRPRRLFHSALGPLVELVIGSLAFVAIYLADVNTWVWDPLVVNTLFKVGMFAFVGAFFKLNPLIELDGYFLLVDIVGVPRLMRRSFYFFTYEIWGKLYRREKFRRIERTYILYFTLAVLWMLVFYNLVLWIGRVHVAPIWDEITGEGILGTGLYLLLLAVLLSPMFLAAWAYIRANLEWFVDSITKFLKYTSLHIVTFTLSGAAILIPFVLQLLPPIPDEGPQMDLAYLALARTLAATGCVAAWLIARRLGREWLDVRTQGFLRAIGHACVFFALAQVCYLLRVMSHGDVAWGLVFGAAASELLAACVMVPAATMSLTRLVEDLRLPRPVRWLLIWREALAFIAAFSFVAALGKSAFIYHLNLEQRGLPSDGVPPDFVWLALLFSTAVGLFVWVLIPLWLFVVRSLFSKSLLPWLFIAVAMSLFFVSVVFQAFDEAWKFDTALTRQHYATNTGAGLALAAALGILLVLRSQVRFRVYTDDADSADGDDDRQPRTAATDAARGTPSEAAALRRLLGMLAWSLMRNVEDLFGKPRRDALHTRLEHSLCHGESAPVRLADGAILDPMADGLPWPDLRRRCRAQFHRITNVFIQEFGWPLYRRALANLHDRLFWQERELAHQHLFGRTNWGVKLIHYEDVALTPERKREIFRRIPLFSEFDEEELFALMGRFSEETFRTGEVVFRAGDDSDKLYVVLSGRVVIEHPEDPADAPQAELRRGDYFGEFALVKPATRTATARCVEPTVMLTLNRRTYRALAHRYRAVERKIQEGFEFLDLLDEMPIFRAMSHQRVREVATCMSLRRFVEGEVVVRQGEIGESFFVVRQGLFAVIRNHGEIDEATIKLLGRGDYFGEVALLESVPRAASVVATSDGELLELKRDDFDRLLGKYVALAPSHAAQVVRRSQETRLPSRSARPGRRGFVDRTAILTPERLLGRVSGRREKVDNLDEEGTGRHGEADTDRFSGTTTIRSLRDGTGDDERGAVAD